MQSNRYDLIIRNGTVIDGTGAPRTRADIAVHGARIAAIGDLEESTAATEIDAADRIVAPGFIDVHTHDDNSLIDKPDMFYKTSQGVTSVVVGNCGISLAPYTLTGDRARPLASRHPAQPPPRGGPRAAGGLGEGLEATAGPGLGS